MASIAPEIPAKKLLMIKLMRLWLALYQASVQATTFKSSMTYEILLIVVIGGIGSVSGSIIASFLFLAKTCIRDSHRCYRHF